VYLKARVNVLKLRVRILAVPRGTRRHQKLQKKIHRAKKIVYYTRKIVILTKRFVKVSVEKRVSIKKRIAVMKVKIVAIKANKEIKVDCGSVSIKKVQVIKKTIRRVVPGFRFIKKQIFHAKKKLNVVSKKIYKLEERSIVLAGPKLVAVKTQIKQLRTTVKLIKKRIVALRKVQKKIVQLRVLVMKYETVKSVVKRVEIKKSIVKLQTVVIRLYQKARKLRAKHLRASITVFRSRVSDMQKKFKLVKVTSIVKAKYWYLKARTVVKKFKLLLLDDELTPAERESILKQLRRANKVVVMTRKVLRLSKALAKSTPEQRAALKATLAALKVKISASKDKILA